VLAKKDRQVVYLLLDDQSRQTADMGSPQTTLFSFSTRGFIRSLSFSLRDVPKKIGFRSLLVKRTFLGNNGTSRRSTGISTNRFLNTPFSCRVINAELRHVRTEKGAEGLALVPSFLKLNTLFVRPDRQIFNDNLTKTLNKAIFMMIQYTSSEQGRQAVPLITERAPDAISPFPFKIQVKVGDVEVG